MAKPNTRLTTPDDMLDPAAHFGLAAVLAAFLLINHAAVALPRHKWWLDAIARLFDGKPAKPLDA